MAILIKDMEMPGSCSECLLIDGEYFACCLDRTKEPDNGDTRPAWCPLVYVPDRHKPNNELLESSGFEL